MRGFMHCLVVPVVLLAGSARAIPVPGLPPFSEVELVHDGLVILRPGTGKVELEAGDRWADTFQVINGRLVIKGCKDCGDRFKVVITTPMIKALAVTGTGKIVLDQPFTRQPSLAASVAGSGKIDARAATLDSLTATVQGGGSIVYGGNPELISRLSGGGTIIRAD